jgi:hypothetical protein
MLGTLQLPVAGLGTLLVAFSIGSILTTSSPAPEGEGFVSGLAILFLYFLAWIGFLILSFGLSIPPGDGFGVTFNRYQRGLFIVAAGAGLLSAVGPFVAFGLLLSDTSLMVNSLLALMGVALLSLLVGLLWRAIQAIQTWRLNDDPSTPSN